MCLHVSALTASSLVQVEGAVKRVQHRIVLTVSMCKQSSTLTASSLVQVEGAVKRVQRRVVLTGQALLERRVSTFEVVRHQALSQLAAVVRFWEEPQWLAFEWASGAPATLYALPGRDALLTATLHAAQVGLRRSLIVWCPGVGFLSGRSGMAKWGGGRGCTRCLGAMPC